METRLVVTIDGRLALSGSRQINSAINTVRSNSRGMVQEIDGSFKRLQQSLFSVRNAIAAVGITQFVRQALQSFGDFETGLVGVGKTTGIAGDALNELGRDIIKMSLEIPVARSELLDIAQAAGQLGIQGSENILKFTEVVAKLGKASDLAGGEAAITLARILGVTNEATDSVDRLASTLVFLGNNAKASESEIAKMVIELAKGTAQFNVSSADLAGLGTTLKEFGQQAELARSTVLKTFLAIKSAVDEGGASLEKLGKLTGQTGEQFKKTFEKDSFAAFLAFVKGLRSVIEQGGNAEQVLGAFGLRGTEVNAILPLLAKNFDALSLRVNQANTAYRENTALNVEAAQAFSTFQSAMQIVANNLLNVFRIIGGKLAPAFITLGERINEIAQGNSIEIFATALGAAFSLLADNIDLVGIALGALALRVTIGLVIKLASGVIGLANAFKVGAAASIAQAAGLNRAAIAANLFTAASARSAISIRNVGIRAKIMGTSLFILDSALSLIGLNTSTLGKLFGGLSGTLATVLPRFLSLSSFSTAAGIAVRGLGIAFGILTGPIGLTVAAVTGLIAIYNTFEDTLIQVGNLNASVGSTMQAVWEVTTSQIGQAVSGFVSTATAKWEELKQATRERFERISTVIKENISSALGSVKSFLQPAIDVFSRIKDTAKEKFLGIVDAARNIVQPVVDKFNDIKKKIIESFTGAFSSIREKFSSFVDKAFPGFVDKVVTKANELEKAKTNITDVGNAAQETADKVNDAAKKIDKIKVPEADIPESRIIPSTDVNVDDFSSKVKDEFSESDRLTEQFVGGFESTFKDGLNSVFRNGRSGFQDMIGGFRNLYFDLLTEVAARPILDFLLGKSSTGFGGRSGGPISDIFGSIFGKKQPETGIAGKVAPESSSVPVPVAKPGVSNILPGDVILGDVTNTGGDFADIFSQQSQGTGGFLGKLGGLFSSSGEGGGFLSSMSGLFDGFTSGLSGVFGGLGSLLSGGLGLAGKGISAGVGGIGSLIGGAVSGIGGLFGGGSTPPAVPPDFVGPLLPGQAVEGTGGGLLSGLGSLFGSPNGGSGVLGGLGSLFGSAEGGSGLLGGLGSLFGSPGGGNGLLGGLTSILGTAGGGGFLGSFASLLGGIGGGSGGGLGGGGGSAASSILGLVGGIAGNILLPGVGGFIGSALGSTIGGFFADGGSVKGKTPIVVGERGPELFVPPVDGEIIPNDKLNNVIPFPADIIRAANDNGLSPGMMNSMEKASNAGKFGGFFADGGSVKAGNTILGGEKGPELFIPSSTANNNGSDSDSGGGDTVIVNINVNTPDATSFKRSQGQLASQAAQAITRARRNL